MWLPCPPDPETEKSRTYRHPDPFATGVLPVALGEGTKAIPFLDESVKEYRAVMRLGISTDTQDCTGKILSKKMRKRDERAHDSRSLSHALSEQFLPGPSHVFGCEERWRALYKLARKGEEVDREPREIMIHSLVIESFRSASGHLYRQMFPRHLCPNPASDMGDAWVRSSSG